MPCPQQISRCEAQCCQERAAPRSLHLSRGPKSHWRHSDALCSRDMHRFLCRIRPAGSPAALLCRSRLATPCCPLRSSAEQGQKSARRCTEALSTCDHSRSTTRKPPAIYHSAASKPRPCSGCRLYFCASAPRRIEWHLPGAAATHTITSQNLQDRGKSPTGTAESFRSPRHFSGAFPSRMRKYCGPSLP